MAAALLGVFLALTALRASAGQQPEISLIQLYLTNQVLVHFDVQANTTCILQYTSVIKTNKGAILWSNLYAAPNLPFFEHYIIVDTRTNHQRFYRLMVTP